MKIDVLTRCVLFIIILSETVPLRLNCYATMLCVFSSVDTGSQGLFDEPVDVSVDRVLASIRLGYF